MSLRPLDAERDCLMTTGLPVSRPTRRRSPGDVLLLVAVAGGERARRAVGSALRRDRSRGDRGDVPGWVLVTLMTAFLVAALMTVARDRLSAVFEQAISSVTGK
jgi:hypothetical protein